MNYEKRVLGVLKELDVEVGGSRPQDIHVHDTRVYKRVMREGSLGLGEAYMDGWWDANNLDVFIAHTIRTPMAQKVLSTGTFWHALAFKYFNLQNKARAFMVGEQHYDIGNDIYNAMLGSVRAYTCAYFNGQDIELEQAQYDKHDLICRKLGIQKGDRVLDIGCGKGEFMYHAAKYYGAEVVGVTVSKEQTKLGEERNAGLPVSFIYKDYRDLSPEIDGVFDHVVSIGMAEQVGNKNFHTYLKVAKSMLKPNGLFLLHTIASNTSQDHGDLWLHKYIFPNGSLPSLAGMARAAEGLFVVEDVHNFGVNYDRTLMEWWKRFDTAWPELSKKYDQRFYRMWKYYLLMCAGLFRARYVQLEQLVLSPYGVEGGYTSVR